MDNNFAIGIDLGGSFIKYAIVKQDGSIFYESKKASKANTSRNKVIENISSAIDECLDIALKSNNINILGIGIGTPGIIDKGLVLGGAENLPSWENLPLEGILRKEFSHDIFIDNDANLMGLGEVKFGGSKDISDAIFISIGTGVGGAMVLNGKLYGGHRNRGAEIGHMSIDRNGISCSCGGKGCLEAYASTSALISDYKKISNIKITKYIDGEFIISQYKLKEEFAVEAMNNHFDNLSTGIASIINIFSPQKIIIGGGISESGDFYIRNISERTHKKVMKETSIFTSIEKAQLGNKAGFMGAAALVFDKKK